MPKPDLQFRARAVALHAQGLSLGEIAQRLGTCRVAAGLSLCELAARSGVGFARIAEYERGRRPPGRRVLGKLAAVLGPALLAPKGMT